MNQQLADALINSVYSIFEEGIYRQVRNNLAYGKEMIWSDYVCDLKALQGFRVKKDEIILYSKSSDGKCFERNYKEYSPKFKRIILTRKGPEYKDKVKE